MPRRVRRVLACGFAVGVCASAPAQAHGTTERVSIGPGGVESNGDSDRPALSAHGRFVAFHSDATNLVPGDTNGAFDVFVRDRQTGTTRRVSLGPGGIQGNGRSLLPALSADGRFVAYMSDATNLVPGDTRGLAHIFVRDRQTGVTQRVSMGPGGTHADDSSFNPVLSADGRFVAFDSPATNLVPGDTNGVYDVFVHDRQAGTTQRVSLGPGGKEGNGFSGGPVISADGRFVAFFSSATNLVLGDTNGVDDVFVHDRQAGTTRRVSVGPGGVQGNGLSLVPALSAHGRFAAFFSAATNLVPGDTNGVHDVFIRDRKTGTTRRVSLGPGGVQADGRSVAPALSADGRFVAFESTARNLVPGATSGTNDVFVRDRQTGTTRRASVGPGGVQADFGSTETAISADGRFVAFVSGATNLVPGDTNGLQDVFVRTP